MIGRLSSLGVRIAVGGSLDSLSASALTSTTPAGGSATNYIYEGNGTSLGDGHLTARGSGTYAWDGQGRLKRATVSGKSACYTYAPDGTLKSRVYDSAGSATCTTSHQHPQLSARRPLRVGPRAPALEQA